MPAVGCVLVEWEAPTRGTQWRLHRGGGVRGWVEAVGMERGQVEQGEAWVGCPESVCWGRGNNVSR